MVAIGIDLGTYNSCAAYAQDRDHVHIIRSQRPATQQGQVFPSFVQFDTLGNVVNYGEDARLQMAYAPESVVWGVKRLIGRSFYEVEKELHRFAYPIAQGAGGRAIIPIGPQPFTPVDISTLMLKWIKQSAEKFNPFIVGKVNAAVVTHPAYFDASQIGQTKEAAAGAGFDEGCVELIAEPVAAALAYGLQLDPNRPQFIMTIDWGAGTLDIVITALRLNREGRPVLSEVRPARGDVALGGIDMDDFLLARAVEIYGLKDFQPMVDRAVKGSLQLDSDLLHILEKDFPVSIAGLLKDFTLPAGQAHPEVDNELWGEFYSLRDCIEGEKINLSKVPGIRGFVTYQGKNQDIKMARTSKDCLDDKKDWIILEEVLKPALSLFRNQVEFAIEKSGLPREAIQHVLLVGGPMHMPCIRKVVLEIFASNRQVVEELMAIEAHGFPVNPMEAVARGAALNASGAGPALGIRVIPRDYGVIVGNQGEILIHDGDGVPYEASLAGALGTRGQPGQAVPIGLYMREESPEGESYKRMGDYDYFPTFGSNGMCSFLPTLKAESDKTVSLIVTDMRNKKPMVLPKLSELNGRAIPNPQPFPRQTEGGEEHEITIPGRDDNPLVSAEVVSQQRRSAMAALQMARSLRQHPLVQADGRVRRMLEEKMDAVDKALRSLPASGPADQDSFASCTISRTELVAFLQVNKLLSDEQRML